MDYAAKFQEFYSTALLADAAFHTGVPLGVATPGLAPLARRDKLAGPVVTVEANNDLLTIMAAVHRAQPGEVVLVSNKTYEVGLIGDLLGLEAKQKGLAGFIVDGSVRDAVELIDLGMVVVCRGLLPIGPLKLAPELKGIGQIGVDVKLGDAAVKPGDWAFADADGVIFLSPEGLPTAFERAAILLEREKALAAEIRAGTSLGDIFGLEAFLEKRAEDPAADFNAHLAALGRAI
jgi:4-hydroxy-4-methyl-2-oxoglutarate aldolase